ncbi:MAG: ATP-binding cassette domain-containing protein [Acidobacteriota bacterium]
MIQLNRISKTYADGTQALAGVDLEIRSGMLGLLGPNGAGKTTLLSILVLALEPSAGARSYFGMADTAKNRSSIRETLGYLPQEFSPVTGLSGIQYLELCARVRKVPLSRKALRRRLWALLEAVELASAARRPADRYSGGMQRRLGLAQALIHSPRFLVVDEPTAGLDPEERIRFRNLITDLAEEIPVLLSTHIVEDIEATCPRLAVIASGRLLFDGPPGALMQRAHGSLWRVPRMPEGDHGLVYVGRRVDSRGIAHHVVHGTSPPVGGEAIRPTLEEACSAFLALEAEQSLDSEASPETS